MLALRRIYTTLGSKGSKRGCKYRKRCTFWLSNLPQKKNEKLPDILNITQLRPSFYISMYCL